MSYLLAAVQGDDSSLGHLPTWLSVVVAVVLLAVVAWGVWRIVRDKRKDERWKP